jgi:hypothetical protein
MRKVRNIVACLLLAASLAGCYASGYGRGGYSYGYGYNGGCYNCYYNRHHHWW